MHHRPTSHKAPPRLSSPQSAPYHLKEIEVFSSFCGYRANSLGFVSSNTVAQSCSCAYTYILKEMCNARMHTYTCLYVSTLTYSIILALTGKCRFWTPLNKVKQRLKENSSSVCPQLHFSCLTFHHKSFSGRQICKGIRPSVSAGPQKPHMLWRPLQRPGDGPILAQSRVSVKACMTRTGFSNLTYSAQRAQLCTLAKRGRGQSLNPKTGSGGMYVTVEASTAGAAAAHAAV